ncbi:MAG: hypothetical protein INR70_31315, partial [Parafilimonas terrae]|nr:hypothetical protein [Parafilimonas terrae]
MPALAPRTGSMTMFARVPILALVSALAGPVAAATEPGTPPSFADYPADAV